MYNNELTDEVKNIRKPTYDIHPIILNRWSPRSLTGEKISEDELFALFEAARWAPSSYNDQPWRFIYAMQGTPDFDIFSSFLVDFNKKWTANASALIVIVSSNLFEKNRKPAITHSFDTGAAWQNMALEGSARGLVIHGMQGFDYEMAKKTLNIPDDYTVEAMAAVGKRAPKEDLPEEMVDNEAPSLRKPLDEIVMKGKFQ